MVLYIKDRHILALSFLSIFFFGCLSLKRVNSIINLMQLVEGKLKTLKAGCNSEILLAERNDLEVVLKAVQSAHVRQVGHLLNEWSLLKGLEHENIIQVLGCLKKVSIPGREGTFYMLAQEYAEEGNLSQLVRNHPQLPFSHRRFLFWELAQAVLYLHCKDIVHRDLKLDNVLLGAHPEGISIKLADFGFATQLEPNQPLVSSYKGTKRGYMAPEIHACKSDSALRYDAKAADMFALGVILYALIMGRLPFEYAVPEDRHYKLLLEDPQNFWKPLTPLLAKLEQTENTMIQEFKSLFEGLVNINPKERLKIEEVLQHPWIQGHKTRPL